MLKPKRRIDLIGTKSENTYYITGTFYHEGESHYIKNKSCKTIEKREANVFAYKLIEQLKNNISLIKSKKYSDAVDLKVNDNDPDTAPSQNTINLVKKTKKFLGNYDIRLIDNDLIRDKAFEMYPMENYLRKTPYNDLTEEEKKQKSARLNTMNRCFICPVSLVLNFASAKRLCEKMVINRFKLIEREPIYFTYDEVSRCLNSTSMFQIKLLMVFLIYTGARLQEALNCKWDDVINLNQKNSEIKIWQGKQDKPRRITIHKNLVAWLNKVNDRGKYIFKWRNAWSNKKNGEGLYFNWRDMLRQANIDFEKTPHKCRHTFATWLRKYSACDIQDLKDIGGWKDEKSVKVYSHIMPDTMPKKINLLP